MNEHESPEEVRQPKPEEVERSFANMDEIDFMTLLMESRIIQAS